MTVVPKPSPLLFRHSLRPLGRRSPRLIWSTGWTAPARLRDCLPVIVQGRA